VPRLPRFTSGRRDALDVDAAASAAADGRLVLVDVREPKERARGFAPGSRHLPLGDLERRLGELPVDRPIAFICQSGRRSAMAVTAARRAGVNARNVAGGMTAWERRGLAVERGA
jgi:rhodanese-related sulfurtransferase